MSIESAVRPGIRLGGNPPPTRDSPGRRFGRALWASITVFALLAAVLVFANLAQGPRLTSAQINVNTSVERAGQRLLLQSNEPLAAVAADQVAITPGADASATVSATGIDIQFSGILSYNTAYTVRVSDVKSISVGASSTFTYTFTTPDPTMYVLVPSTSPGQSDTITTTPLSGGASDTVYSAPHIRRFVVFPTALVVDTVNDDGTDALTIVSLTGAAPIPVQIAGPGTITSLTASPGSNLFGYTFTPQASASYAAQPDQLYAYDITRGQDYAIPITGTDHEQLTAKNWMFVPNSTSLVAQTADNSLVLIDTLGEREGTSGAVAVGQTDSLVGFVPGTKTLVSMLDGSPTATDFSQPTHPRTAFDLVTSSPTSEAVLDSATSSLQFDPSRVKPGVTGQPVVRMTASGPAVLFAPTAASGGVTQVCVAPNGSYAAVLTENSQIFFIDIARAAVLSATTGQQTNWCSGH